LIDLEKVGGSYLDVNQGQKIHIMCKAQKESDNDVRFMYGYDGYNPDQIKD
jgi:hypothetical protein